MSRNLVFATLAVSVCGLLTLLVAYLPFDRGRGATDGSAAAESRAWRRLLLPLLPAFWALALLGGWTGQEPRVTDEFVMPIAYVVAAVPLLVGMRAVILAVWRTISSKASGPACTIGLLRPRVVISPELRRALDQSALAAAEAHEEAHARHRDPLRIWLAYFAADLQWPSPSAVRRLNDWRHALELARDDQARGGGVSGDDLAAAVIGAVKLMAGRASATGAALTGPEHELSSRIYRLLEPLAPQPSRSRRSFPVTIALTGALLAAVVGIRLGDIFVRALPFVAAQEVETTDVVQRHASSMSEHDLR